MITIKGVFKFFAYLRTVQGSRGAPLTWARSVALVMRLTCSLFKQDSVRLCFFVDDPLAILRGSPLDRQFTKTLILLVWEGLGFPLSCAKGQHGCKVTWIGGVFDLSATSLTVSTKESIYYLILLPPFKKFAL